MQPSDLDPHVGEPSKTLLARDMFIRGEGKKERRRETETDRERGGGERAQKEGGGREDKGGELG